jgi:hypothetical protein
MRWDATAPNWHGVKPCWLYPVPENLAARTPGVDAGGAGGSATRAKPLLASLARSFCATMFAHGRAAIRKAVRPAFAGRTARAIVPLLQLMLGLRRPSDPFVTARAARR